MSSMTVPAPESRVKARLRHFVSRQVTDVELPSSWSVHEATEEIARAIALPAIDGHNRRQHYELFVRRGDGSAERLRAADSIRQAVREGDEIEAMPEVQPGAAHRRV